MRFILRGVGGGGKGGEIRGGGQEMGAGLSKAEVGEGACLPRPRPPGLEKWELPPRERAPSSVSSRVEAWWQGGRLSNRPGSGFRSLSDVRLRAQVGLGVERPGCPRLGKTSLGTDPPGPHSGYLSRDAEEMETSVLLPRRALPSEGAGEVRASPSLSRAGAGAEPSSLLPPAPGLEGKGRNRDPPPGEGLRANAAGRLPGSPSPLPPPAPPAASAAARRSSAAFPAQSVSPRRWVSGGCSGRGWVMRGGGSPEGGGPVQPLQPRGSRASRGASFRGRWGEGGYPGEERGALQGPDRRVASGEESRSGRLGAPPPGGAPRPAL